MKRLLSLFTVLVLALSCVSALSEAAKSGLSSLTATGKMELEYAAQFSVDYFEGGYALITNSDGARFLTIPEGAEIPEGLDEDIVTLQLPLQNLLISSTPVTSLINAVGALGGVAVLVEERVVATAVEFTTRKRVFDQDAVCPVVEGVEQLRERTRPTADTLVRLQLHGVVLTVADTEVVYAQGAIAEIVVELYVLSLESAVRHEGGKEQDGCNYNLHIDTKNAKTG